MTYITYVVLFAFLLSFYSSKAQDTAPLKADTQQKALIKLHSSDSILQGIDSMETDTLLSKRDTLKKPQNKDELKAKVKYSAKDSIIVDVIEHKIYLYGSAEITYQAMNIKAAYIEINFKKNEMYACGVKDTTGKLKGSPVFTEDKETFTSENMTYNFKTKKGLIRHIFTKEGEGYLHGDKVKKLADNVTFLNTGSYTTCDEENPDFEIRFIRAKVIPGDKIICGPALLFVEGVPTPLGVPFGYFPISTGRRSGILIPSYGESADRGFYFENGGYYWGINDYTDAIFRGDIYTRGSWALKTTFNYNKLYNYNGSLDLDYAYNLLPIINTNNFSTNRDFFVRWLYNQSDKARPNSRFSANVNAGSSNYNTFNSASASDYLTNTFQSAISYSTVIADEFNFSLNARHNQNTQTKMIDITLPEITLSANRFYPFQQKERVGTPKWYENINVNYTMDARNEINDSISHISFSRLFNNNELKKLNNGILHTITASSSNKVFKYVSWTNSLNYNEFWYFNQIRQNVQNNTVKTDTLNKFSTARDASFTSSLSSRLYGMYQFKNGYIRAIRHVITPTIGITLSPDFEMYYRHYQDINNKDVKYSIFQNGMFGAPPGTRSGLVNFSITNNLEMKVKSAKDTITGLKKIVLIENFTISESYDLFKDSIKWSPLSLSGHTRLFKNIDLKYSSTWSPYVIDTSGRQRNKYYWNLKDEHFFKQDNTNWALSINWNISSKNKPAAVPTQNKTGAGSPMNPATQQQTPGDITSPEDKNKIHEPPPTNFNIPWNLNIYYTFSWTNQINSNNNQYTRTAVQTLSFNGDINLTKKWRIGVTSGYDFMHKGFSYSQVNIYRDLHCWEMLFNWIPIGLRKSYNFTIRVKASMLQDLKLMKKTDWKDNGYQ